MAALSRTPEQRKLANFRYKLWNKYRITPEEFYDLLEQSNFQCSICSKEIKGHGEHQGTKERACVDHNHKTGKVRGILCADCNWGLGLFQDNPELLIKAAKYLNGRNC